MKISGEKSIRYGRLLLFIVSAFGLLIFLGLAPLWGSEDRWAEISREMLLYHDFLHPAINGEIYFDKPQLSYWLIVLFGWISGVLNEFVVRLPSALAGLAALAGVWWLGKRLYDEKTANLAAWVMLGCYGFLFWARSGAADMANVAAITLAMAFFIERKNKSGFFSYFIFYLICALGALTKGLPALVMPFVLIAPFLWRDGEWKKHLKWSNLAAFILAMAIYLLPFYLAATMATPEFYTRPAHTAETGSWCCAVKKYLPLCEILPDGTHNLTGFGLVVRENLVRVFKPFDHDDEPFFCYVYHLPRIMLPLAPLFILALAGFVKRRKTLSANTRDLLWGAALMFVLFSLSGSRRWYYILPLLAPCTLLTAVAFSRTEEEGVEKWNAIAIKLYRYLLITTGSLAVLSLMLYPVWRRVLPVAPPLLFLIALPLFGVIGMLLLFLDEVGERDIIGKIFNLPRRPAAVIVVAALFTIGVFSCLVPSMWTLRKERDFIRGVTASLHGSIAPEQVFLWNHEPNARLVFYLDYPRPVKVGFKTGDLKRFMKDNAGRKVMLITYTRKRNMESFQAAVKELGLDININEPSYREPRESYESRKSRKLHIWIKKAEDNGKEQDN